MRKYTYDLAILGGGSAGITAAVFAAGIGKKTAIIDKSKFGGECTWSGCMPSKSLIKSAQVMELIKRSGQFGLALPASLAVNTEQVMESVRRVSEEIYTHEDSESFKKLGIDPYEEASVHFIDPHTLEVNGNMLTAKRFIIASGSSPLVPQIPGLSAIDYYTNENIFSLKTIPQSMIILGGGPIGVELASAFNRLGCKVTIVEMADSILFREDREMAEMLAGILKAEGVKLLTSSQVVSVTQSCTVDIFYVEAGIEKKISADTLLVSVGRKPNVEGLSLEKAGVTTGLMGIAVNSYLRTTAKNIYAAGDVTGPYRFSHMANYQAIIAAGNALLPVKRKCNYNNVPWITFTEPELARTGLTEKEALTGYGPSLKVFRIPYTIDRARTERDTRGMGKFICHKNGKILGAHILGERAGEVLHQVHMARTLNISLYKINSVIHAYPAYSDIIKNAARAAYIDHLQNNIIIKILSRLRKVFSKG